MRVLHILNDVTDRGNGIVNAAVDLAMEQTRQGMVVAVASAGGGYSLLLERAGVLHFELDQSRHPVQLIRAAWALRRLVVAFGPDIVHAHMRTGLILAWLWRRYPHFALVGHVHNVHDRESVMMGLADRVIAVSESVAATMGAQGIARDKIRVVLNRTLGTQRFPALAETEPASLVRPSIVTVCGMSHRKGVEELIAAFELVAATMPEVHLYLVGDGPERALFEAQASSSTFRDRIHFAGFQTRPLAYMLSADVFVLASRRESFGLVLTEAREAGCAIVATDVDGIAEALDGGRAGVLVPARNVTALAGALQHMLGDVEDRVRWQTRSKQGIEGFRVDVMAAEVYAVYDDLLHEHSRFRISDTALLR